MIELRYRNPSATRTVRVSTGNFNDEGYFEAKTIILIEPGKIGVVKIAAGIGCFFEDVTVEGSANG